MDAICLHTVVEQDGEVTVTGLPFKRGQRLEMVLLAEPPAPSRRKLTARMLLESGLIGLWQDRDDIGDSSAFARQLREQAQRRS